jgi:hypothetical protein
MIGFCNPNPALVLMFWDMGYDTNEIANRLGSRESDVYRILVRRLAIRRKARDASLRSYVPAKR